MAKKEDILLIGDGLDTAISVLESNNHSYHVSESFTKPNGLLEKDFNCLLITSSCENLLDSLGKLRNNEKDLPIILIGEPKGFDLKEIINLGMDGVVKRENIDEELPNLVENAISSYREKKEMGKIKAKFKAFMKHTPASIYFKDKKRRHEEVSNYFIDDMNTEYSPEAFTGKRDEDLHESELAEKTKKDEKEIIENGSTVDQEMEYSEREQKYNLTTKGPVRDKNGEIQGIFGITMDVTERKEKTIILESLQETSSEMLRHDTKQEICSTTLSTLEDIMRFKSAGFYQLLEGETNLVCGSKSFEEHRTKEIDTQVAELTQPEISSNKLEGKNTIYTVKVGEHGVITIITQGEIEEFRKDALSILASNSEAALDRIKNRKEKRKLKEFGDIISHELRNPLNIAMGYTDGLENSNDVKEIKQALDRMERIIEDLGELARRNDSIKRISRIELSEIINEAWSEIEAGKNKLQVKDSIIFRGDRDRLFKAFENILRNSVEHGGNNVTIEVGSAENGFYIQDNGKGIEDSEKDKIFGYNFSTNSENAGIGLSITKRIIEGHGWNIEATDSEDDGARFDIKGQNL